MTTAATQRTRTTTWQDPHIGARAGAELPGLEYLRAMIAGKLPPAPFAQTVGFSLVEANDGRAVFEIEPMEFHYNPSGAVHGGVACTLLDSAMGCAVHTMLNAGQGYTTAELSVNIVRAASERSGPLRTIGTVVHCGRRLATAEGRIVGPDGKLYAHGTTTCLVFDAEVR